MGLASSLNKTKHVGKQIRTLAKDRYIQAQRSRFIRRGHPSWRCEIIFADISSYNVMLMVDGPGVLTAIPTTNLGALAVCNGSDIKERRIHMWGMQQDWWLLWLTCIELPSHWWYRKGAHLLKICPCSTTYTQWMHNCDWTSLARCWCWPPESNGYCHHIRIGHVPASYWPHGC